MRREPHGAGDEPRRPAGSRGEHVYVLHPLAPPNAATLFVERARRRTCGAGCSAEDERAVVDAICARLDGLPLAIELAADRVRLLSLPALLARLERRLDVLTEGRRDRPQRQRSLRATLEWSWDVLDERERRLLCLLTVFEGGAPLDAAVAVAGGDRAAVEGVVASLLDKTSLLRSDVSTRSRASACSTRCASSPPSAPPASRRLRPRSSCTRATSSATASGWRPRRRARTAATRSSGWPHERGNIRLAYERLLRAGHVAEALRVAVAFAEALPWDAHTHEVRAWLEGGLDALPEDAPGLRATALYWDGMLAISQARFAEADPRLRAALAERARGARASDRGGVADRTRPLGDAGREPGGAQSSAMRRSPRRMRAATGACSPPPCSTHGRHLRTAERLGPRLAQLATEALELYRERRRSLRHGHGAGRAWLVRPDPRHRRAGRRRASRRRTSCAGATATTGAWWSR